MARPQTLLELAGARTRPHKLGESALILIDIQREYVEGKLALPGVGPAVEAATRLLDQARIADGPIFHIAHRGKSGGLFDPDTPMFEFADPIRPTADEPVVTKTLPNAFAGTDLLPRLQSLGVKSLIVGGFMSHMCVSSTIRAALDLGFGCTVVANACATRDLPGPGDSVISAGDLHRAEMAALADRFAIVVQRPEELTA